jgi:hypothetical protein
MRQPPDRELTPFLRQGDSNKSIDDGTHPRGWRMTGTLKCAVCKSPTRHALLRDDNPDYRDVAECEHMGPNYPFRPQGNQNALTPTSYLLFGPSSFSGYGPNPCHQQ